MARLRSLSSAHTPARSARPPSSGSPGSTLKTATSTLLAASWKAICPAAVRSGSASVAAGGDAAEHQRHGRTGQADQRVDPRAGGVAVHLGPAAEQLQGDAAHADAVPAGGQRVAELVQQHRAEQADHEAEADQVAERAGQAELGPHVVAVDDRDQQRRAAASTRSRRPGCPAPGPPAGPAGRCRAAAACCRPPDPPGRCYGSPRAPGRTAFSSYPCPSLSGMTAQTAFLPFRPAYRRTAATARPRLRRRRTPGRALAVAVAGGRLQDLPAAVPLPHHRQAARAALRRPGPRHPGARGAGAAVRPAGRRAHARGGGRPGRPVVGAAARARSPALAEIFAADRRPPGPRPGGGGRRGRRDGPGRLFAAAQDAPAPTRPPGWRRSWPVRAACSTAISRSRTRDGSSPPSGRAWSPRWSTTSC